MHLRRMSKATILVSAFLLVTMGFAGSLHAIQRMGYILDKEGKRIPSPLSYIFHKEINGTDYECGPFVDPKDICIDRKGNLFIADSGNDRILKFDKSSNFVRAFGSSKGEFNGPEGVFVDEEDNIYVADTGNYRVLKLDVDGRLLKEYKRPSSPLFGQGGFYPTKLVVDGRGYVYVLNKGDTRGLILIDGKGMFRGFFAPVRLPFSLTRLFFQLFATKEQKEDARTHRNPYCYSNVAIDDSGFIYTASEYLEKDQIKKITPVGINVYPEEFYGETRVVRSETVLSQFIDLAIDNFGIVSALDVSSGNVYQYDQEGHLLAILAGKGKQENLFEHPISIATLEGGTLYVLDDVELNVKVFYPTKLTQLIHQSARLYFEGKYYEAENLWKEVARKNSNFALAHTGLGKALLKRGDYLGAMEEFRYAKDKEGFSKAFKEYRHIWLRKHFGWVALWILIGITALAILSKLVPKLLEKYGKEAGSFLKTFSHLFMILIRPRETLENIRKANLFSVLLFVLLFFLIGYLRILLISFHFSTFDPEKTSFFMESLKLFLPWITWVFASYGVSMILDGQGTLKDIFISSALCLSPYIIFSVPLSLLSRILVLEQKGYYDFLNYLIYAWVIFLFFCQVKVVHNFSSKKTVGFSLLSVLGVGIVWASAALIYALSYQVFDFVRQIILEISIRG